jgi:hypothetical protein
VVLAVVAGAKHDGRIGTDVIEEDGGVAGWVDCTKPPVEFFHKKRDRGVGVWSCCRQKGKRQKCTVQGVCFTSISDFHLYSHPSL